MRKELELILDSSTTAIAENRTRLAKNRIGSKHVDACSRN